MGHKMVSEIFGILKSNTFKNNLCEGRQMTDAFLVLQ